MADGTESVGISKSFFQPGVELHLKGKTQLKFVNIIMAWKNKRSKQLMDELCPNGVDNLDVDLMTKTADYIEAVIHPSRFQCPGAAELQQVIVDLKHQLIQTHSAKLQSQVKKHMERTNLLKPGELAKPLKHDKAAYSGMDNQEEASTSLKDSAARSDGSVDRNFTASASSKSGTKGVKSSSTRSNTTKTTLEYSKAASPREARARVHMSSSVVKTCVNGTSPKLVVNSNMDEDECTNCTCEETETLGCDNHTSSNSVAGLESKLNEISRIFPNCPTSSECTMPPTYFRTDETGNNTFLETEPDEIKSDGANEPANDEQLDETRKRQVSEEVEETENAVVPRITKTKLATSSTTSKESKHDDEPSSTTANEIALLKDTIKSLQGFLRNTVESISELRRSISVLSSQMSNLSEQSQNHAQCATCSSAVLHVENTVKQPTCSIPTGLKLVGCTYSDSDDKDISVDVTIVEAPTPHHADMDMDSHFDTMSSEIGKLESALTGAQNRIEAEASMARNHVSPRSSSSLPTLATENININHVTSAATAKDKPPSTSKNSLITATKRKRKNHPKKLESISNEDNKEHRDKNAGDKQSGDREGGTHGCGSNNGGTTRNTPKRSKMQVTDKKTAAEKTALNSKRSQTMCAFCKKLHDAYGRRDCKRARERPDDVTCTICDIKFSTINNKRKHDKRKHAELAIVNTERRTIK